MKLQSTRLIIHQTEKKYLEIIETEAAHQKVTDERYAMSLRQRNNKCGS